ncbi:MAG: flagellin [Methanoregula sp.]|uniref:flagellin n=1 Tax=Methanoregula sp. TaxID=2052170 RepID=UPI003C77AE91
MSSETITTALFLITAVIAASVLIAAIFPVIYQMAGTFSSASHTADQNIRTDFKIISSNVDTTTTPPVVYIWMKNVGSAQIPYSDITSHSDVLCGNVGSFGRLTYGTTPSSGYWQADLSDMNSNNYWDPGETLEIIAEPPSLNSDNDVYFQFVLPDGIWRSTQFPLR